MVAVDFLLYGSRIPDGGGIDAHEHVALLYAGLVCCAACSNLVNIYSVYGRKFQFGSLFFVNVLHGYAQNRTFHAAEVYQIGNDPPDYVHRHRERIAGVGPGLGDDGSVDAHQFPGLVHEGSATVARIHGRIGLDEGFDLELTAVVRHRAALCADYSGRDGGTQVVRAAYGYHPFAQTETVGIAHRNGREALRVDLY